MIKTQIFLENQQLDVYNDVAAEFTYSIDDIKDFAARNTSFSKTIVLPGSATNNKLFGHIFEFASLNPYNPATPNVGINFNASVAANCLILIDNVQVFKGVLRLLQINVDSGNVEYECVVFGELGGFANALANKKIEDLDFNFYNHNWTVENITSSWNSINGSGYFYPLIDYGKVSANKLDYDVKAFRPALYVREYLDKIITNSGYTYDAPFFDTAFFKRLIIPNNQRELTKQTSTLNSAELTVEQTIRGTSNVRFTTVTGSGLVPSASNSIFTYTSTSPTTLKVTYEFFGGSSSGVFYIQKNDTSVYTFSFSGGFAIQGEINIPVIQDDYISFRFTNTAGGRDEPPIVVESASISFGSSGSVPAPLSYGDSITMVDMIPKGIFQRDFVTSIIKMFNLYVIEDTQRSKHLLISPASLFYERGEDVLLAINDLNDLLIVEAGDVNLIVEPGESAYIDWSYKVDRSKPFTLKPMSEINGRYFEYKYKSDNDYYNEQYQKKYEQGYADRIVDTGFAFANDKQTAEIIFSATPLVGYMGRDKVVSIILKLTNVGTIDQAEDRTDHNIRIMQAAKITDVTSWALKNGVSTITSLTSYGYGGHLDNPKEPTSDINFGVPRELYFTEPSSGYPATNLFSAFWSEYVAEITDKDSKLLTCFVRLTDVDIYNLNFSRLIHIDGALFRLNKVIDYKSDDVTKCELLRVIETTYE